MIDDGGPAFPGPNDGNCPGDAGMTLRDYFAGQVALAFAGANWLSLESAARKSYEIADALITERSKEKTS